MLFVVRELQHAAWLEREKKAQAGFTLLKEKEERKRHEREEREVRTTSLVHVPFADCLRVCPLATDPRGVGGSGAPGKGRRREQKQSSQREGGETWFKSPPVPSPPHVPHPYILLNAYILFLILSLFLHALCILSYMYTVHKKEKRELFLSGFP